MATGSYLSVITLNVNGLNAPTKRQRLAEWIQKQLIHSYVLLVCYNLQVSVESQRVQWAPAFNSYFYSFDLLTEQ